MTIEQKMELIDILKTNPEKKQAYLAKQYNVSRNMVYRIKKDIEEQNTFTNIEKHKKDKDIVEHIKNNPKVTVKELSNIYDYPQSRIYNLIKKEGLILEKTHKIGKKEKNILEYVKAHPDISQKEIGKVFGVSRQYVSYCCKINKIYGQNRRPMPASCRTDEYADKIKQNIKKGDKPLKIREISEILNISPNVARKVRKKVYGIGTS